VLETGAVIGYRFDHDLLWQISGRDEEEVIEALESLLGRQMLREEEGTYRFAHDLVRNVVYRDLSYGRRRLLHRRAGEAIEKAQPGRASVLAHHFERAEELVTSIEYRLIAGRQAMETAAPEEAISHLTQALVLFRALPGSAQLDPLELKLQLALGVARQIHRGHGDTEAAQAHARAKILAQKLDDTSAHFTALGLLLMFHATRGEQEKAESAGKELLRLTERSGDPALIMISHWQLGTQRLIGGDLVKARRHLEEAVSLYDPARHHTLTFRYGLEPGVMSLGMLSMALWMLGYPDQSLERGRASLALAKALDFPPGIAMAGILACVTNGYLGDWEKVHTLASETMRISEEHALVYWRTAGLIHRGRALVEMGKGEQGLIQIRQGIDESRATGAQVFTIVQFNMLAEIYLTLDRVPEALDAVESAMLIARETGEHFGEPDAHRIQGDLLARKGTYHEAERAYQNAISMARGQRARSLELRATAGLTRLRQRRGCEGRSYKDLADIYDRFTEGFDSADLREAQDLLRSRH
jgi:adenylate cyclase